MLEIQKETLQAVLEEFHGYPQLAESIDELVEPKMGLISGFQDMIDAVEELRNSALKDYGPF